MAGRLRQALPGVKERAGPYESRREKFVEQIRRCSTVDDNLIVLDLPDEEIIFSGNRFLIHAPFPEVNISIRVIRGSRKTNTVFAVGKSVFNRTSRTNIGELVLKYGGGHEAAGARRADSGEAPRILEEAVRQINADG